MDVINWIKVVTPLVFLLVVGGCSTKEDENQLYLERTIAVQETQIAQLETEMAEQSDTNFRQWEAMSFLFTQMPYALGVITPVPLDVTITPTAYEPGIAGGPTYTPTPWLDLEYPPETRTGLEEVDRVIDAILNGDAADRTSLVRTLTYPCSTEGGLGGPPECREGETTGTLVEVFPVIFSEGFHVRPDELTRTFDFSVRGLLVVYVVPPYAYQEAYWPAGEYGLVFSTEEGGYSHSIIALVEGGEIVRLEFDPDWPPFENLWRRSDEFILPPVVQPDYPTPFPLCTPPPCQPDEVYYCPGDCPGGCGTGCATPTP